MSVTIKKECRSRTDDSLVPNIRGGRQWCWWVHVWTAGAVTGRSPFLRVVETMRATAPHLHATISERYIYITLHKSSEQSASDLKQNIAPVQWKVNKLAAGTVHQQRREIRSRPKIRYKKYEGEPAYCMSCVSQPIGVGFNELSIFNLAIPRFSHPAYTIQPSTDRVQIK